MGAMTVERAKWVAIIALFLLDIVIFYVGYDMGKNSLEKVVAEKNQAIYECTEDILDKCGNLFQYAASLEDENARLNKKIDKLKGKLNAK